MEDNQENVENKKAQNQENDIEIKEQDNKKAENEKEPKEELVENEEKTVENEKQENKEMIKVEKNKKLRKRGYIIGTIGAILGSLVVAILWILVYSINSMVIPPIAMLIPIGAYFGYKISGARISKATKKIIVAVSLLMIIIVTTIICPAILVVKSQYELNWENIMGLYSDTRENIRKAIISDLIIGLIFTIIGLIVTIKAFLKKEFIQEQTELFNQVKRNKLKEQSEIIKKACIDLNCNNEENAVKKGQIIEQLKIVYNIKGRKAKKYFGNCLSNKLLIKNKGKYYYNETVENAKIEKVRKYISPIKIIIPVLIIAIIAIYYGVSKYIETKEDYAITGEYTVTGTSLKLKIDTDTQTLYGTTEEISEGVSEEAAKYYTFIIEEKNEKYEISGQLIEKSKYEEDEIYDMSSAIQQDRDYYSQIFGEEYTSEVEDKEFDGKKFKSYSYDYMSSNKKDCKSQVYLYEIEEQYLWLEVRSLRELETTEVDQLIQNLFK